jgi:cell division GTPase FtsZ
MEEQPTRWSLIASGEGANRISFLYYAKFRNPAIGDRVLLLNTTMADMKPEKTFEYILTKDPNFRETFEKIKREKICIFGTSPSGAGNNWKVGENEARKDFDTIRRYIANLRLGGRDVIMGISTLGGGTGNGSLPYLIYEMKYGQSVISGGENSYLALGILPYEFEAPQRFFNTVCGISRLLRFGKEGHQNADLLLLVDNNQVEKVLGIQKETEKEERYYRINEEIIKAIHLMIAPGGRSSKSTIDVSDYYQLPSNIGVYHFTPCLSLENDPEIIGIEAALETAVQRPMAPIDVKTAIMAYIVVVAPQKYVDNGTFSQEELERITKDWAVKNLAGSRGGILRYSALVSSKEAESLDVMILLGGFSLKKIMANSLQKYYDFKESLRIREEEVEIPDVENPKIRVSIGREDMEAIERRMREYIQRTEDRIERAQSRELDLKKKMEEWGFRPTEGKEKKPRAKR